MKISIVTTMYRSENHIGEFCTRMSNTVKQITGDYEIILVNDGSPDNSRELVLSLVNKDRHLKLVDLSRNYGQHKAIMTGLRYAGGDYVFLIDCDLEEEPELLLSFWEKFNTYDDIDVLYGVQKKRKGKPFESLSGNLFYNIFNSFSNTPIPQNLTTCRLMNKYYVQALIQYREREIFLAGIWHDVGFAQKPFIIEKHDRSPTTYNLRKKIALVVNSITSFSNKPLIAIFYLGIVIGLCSFLFILYLVVKKFAFGVGVIGWTSVIASIWFIGGCIISCIGLVGMYISKIFVEIKQRPYTLIKGVHEKSNVSKNPNGH